MENLRDALEYVVDLKDNEEKIVRSLEQTEENTTTRKRTTCESWNRAAIRNR